MSYILFLDDQRMPEDVTWVKNINSGFSYNNNGQWTIVRNFKEFCETIKRKGLPVFISFDHDLADEHYPWNNQLGIPRYGKYKELTGYEAAQWLVGYCMKHKLPLPQWAVHSMNVIGRENIECYLENFEKHQGSVDQLEGVAPLKTETV